MAVSTFVVIVSIAFASSTLDTLQTAGETKESSSLTPQHTSSLPKFPCFSPPRCHLCDQNRPGSLANIAY